MLKLTSSILRPLKLCEFWRPQNGLGFDDREKSHIASIWPTKDRRKMGCYDGRKNSHNLSGRSIYSFHLKGTLENRIESH